MKSLLLAIMLSLVFMGSNNNEPAVFVDSLEDAIALAESSKKDILVVFGATWCGHCKKTKDDINVNINSLPNIIIVYVDIDNRKDLKKEYMVGKIPDYMMLKNKIETKRNVGYMKINQLKDFIYQ